MRSTPIRRHAGFTIVEILVSITIGLVIMIAIGGVYQTSTTLQRQKENIDELNEPIQQVSTLLRESITQAGYIDAFDAPGGNSYGSSIFSTESASFQNSFIRNTTVGAPVSPLQRVFSGLFPVFGCDGSMNSTPNAIAATTPPVALSCSATTSAVRHTLQLAYQAVPSSTNSSSTNSLVAANTTTGEGRDCLQQSLVGTSGIVINRYYVTRTAVASGGDGVYELYCRGSGASAGQPLARGVEEFVVRYQLAQAGGATLISAGGAKSQYLTATQVAADAVGWPGVSAVEICIVVATPQPSGGGAAGTVSLQPTRPTCERAADGEFKDNITRTSGDTRLWKRFTYTVAVKNAIFAFPF